MRRYFPSMKRYSWIILVCVMLTGLAGAVFAKSQQPAYQASASLLVDAGAPGSTFQGAAGTTSDSISQAANDAVEIPTRSVMNFVYSFDPQIAQRHYTADDLVLDTSVTAPSTTTSTFAVTLTAAHAQDAVLLVNDVALGYQAYKTKELQDQLNADRKNLQTQIAAATQQKTYWEGKIQSLASTTLPDYTIYNNNLTDVTHTIDGLETSLQALPTTVRSDVFITSLAKLSDVTSTSKGTLIVAATTGIGLVLGILLMLLMVTLDNRLRGDDLVKEKLGLAYLGGISSSDQIKNAKLNGSGVAGQDFADISANLRLTRVLPGQWQAPQGAMLLITSAQAAEGKSTVAVALASTVARGGGTAVVVEGNLRKPSAHLSFGMSQAGIGLSGLLRSTGGESIDNVVQRSNITGVWILPGGQPMDDPTFMLSQKLPAILAQLRKKADLVIIDGPALLSGADAALLATMVDGVAVVLDSRHDKLPLLLRAKEVLVSLTGTPCGIILNRLPRRKDNRYFASALQLNARDEQWVAMTAHESNGHGNGHDSRSEQNGKQATPVTIPPSPTQALRMQDSAPPPSPGPAPRVQDFMPPPSPSPVPRMQESAPTSPTRPNTQARPAPDGRADGKGGLPNPKSPYPGSGPRRGDMSPPPLRPGKSE